MLLAHQGFDKIPHNKSTSYVLFYVPNPNPLYFTIIINLILLLFIILLNFIISHLL